MKIFVIVVISLLLICIMGAFIGGYCLFDLVFNAAKATKRARKNPPPLTPEQMRINQMKEEFYQLPFDEMDITSFDGLRLHGYYLKNKIENITILCVHGYTSDAQGDFYSISKFYLEKGYSLLLVDDRGHGKSEGKYAGFGELDYQDVIKWVYRLKEINPKTKIILHGISMGGASVLHCSNKNLPIDGIISDCGFSSIEELTKYLIQKIYHVPYFPFGYCAWLFAKIIAKISFNKSNAVEEVKSSNVPIAIITGDQDELVPLEMTKRIYDAINNKKEIMILPGIKHACSFIKEEAKYKNFIYHFIDEII